jgi:putative ABC transport system ATP-binding protein
MAILLAQNLKKQYGEGPNIVHALNGVDIEVNRGEFVAVVGMSGSGKSTLLHMLGGLDRPTSGKVVVNGQELLNMTEEQLAIFRRRSVGFVFQSYNLIPIINVYENIVFPIELDGKKPDGPFVDEIINELGLWDKRAAMPNMLSGGQQQRVAIARALSAKPSIVLADEPTGNLDSKTSQDVLSLLNSSARQFQQTLILITHNESIAKLADRVIRIEDGIVIDEASGK